MSLRLGTKMAIKKSFAGNMIYKPGYWGGPMIKPLDEMELAVWRMFKTFEKFGLCKNVSCMKWSDCIIFQVDNIVISEDVKEFKARFFKKIK